MAELMTIPADPSEPGFGCELHQDHGSAQPYRLVFHHIKPIYLQKKLWDEVLDDETIKICDNGHATIHDLLSLMLVRGLDAIRVPKLHRAEFLSARMSYLWFMGELNRSE